MSELDEDEFDSYPDHNSVNKNDIISRRWYEWYPEYNNTGEIEELKPNELKELTDLCKKCYDNEATKLLKNNPTDAKWLQTALHKGTARDKANSGALLVQSNPVPNLPALDTLIAQTKQANNRSPEVVEILTELFINALLPADRKLSPIQLRAADWKNLKKSKIEQKLKNKIFAHWHYESELKEHYFTFLKNIQQGVQTGKEYVKCKGIIALSKLLAYAPEKEQMILSSLVNKLGDPVNKVSGKTLYHLLEVSYKHPNMCGVITDETERLLFRSNITPKTQHYALSFLSQIASRASSEVCTKLVRICFSYFKLLIEKGEINNKLMQAILLCLRRSITEAKLGHDTDNSEILPKETLDTIYRVVHVADIQIALQALCVMLQLMVVKSGKYDRFYSALYCKLLEPELAFLGHKHSSLLFYILHRSIYLDSNISRCHAMVKRLLQAAVHFPPSKICATLIVLDKLLKARPELRDKNEKNVIHNDESKMESFKKEILNQFKDDTDEDEKYVDADEKSEKEKNQSESKDENESKLSKASWVHMNLSNSKKKSIIVDKNKNPTRFDYMARNPAFAGGEFCMRTELFKFVEHYHPTVKVFAQTIIDSHPLIYKGDPIRDFSLTHFLERFSFRNPRKPKKDEEKTFIHKMFSSAKNYTPLGSRNIPIKSLTAENCSIEEKYIFEFLEYKRNKIGDKLNKKDDDQESNGSIDDDEFDSYLDSLGAAKGEEEDFDYMQKITDEMKTNKKEGKQKKKNVEDDDDDDEVDYLQSDQEDDDGLEGFDEDNEFGSEDGSISLEEDDGSEDDDEIMTFDDDEDDENDFDFGDPDSDDNEDEPKSKKVKSSQMSAKDFNRKLKHSDNMQSLFAAADDFAEILEEGGKSKKHGTFNEVFNKDKASDKQLAWEDKRHQKFHNPKLNKNQWKNNKGGSIKKFNQNHYGDGGSKAKYAGKKRKR